MGGYTGIRLGIVRGISHGVFGPPASFMEPLRALGGRVARVFLTWNQIEPRPGIYDWSAVDSLIDQIAPGDEIWITLVSASHWATKVEGDLFPASMPRDDAAYQLFVGALVSHCRGLVRYWQCNNEPSNPALWSGSAADYVALAEMFARTVRTLQPDAQIVLGGCGFDVLSATADSPARLFFNEVLDNAQQSFDLFDLHLYDDPRRIPEHFGHVREIMRGHGGERPIVVGEYGGPTLLEFPQLDHLMQQVMGETFGGEVPSLDCVDLTKMTDTPDRLAMRSLYDRMAELPPELQMLMQHCPPALEAKRHRIACREIVTRNLLALAEGAHFTLCWNLAPEAPNHRDPLNLGGFLSDKLALMDFTHGDIARREPAADSFTRLATFVNGATAVRRLATDPGLVAMEIDREAGPLFAFWLEADPLAEDEPPRLVDWPWHSPAATIVDAFGASRELSAADGRLSLAVNTTPLFVIG